MPADERTGYEKYSQEMIFMVNFVIFNLDHIYLNDFALFYIFTETGLVCFSI